MSFSHPEAWWLLTPVGVLVLWLALERKRRVLAWRRLAQRGIPPRQGTVILVATSLLLITALSQPRFGPDLRSPLPPGQDLVILIDVSLSMGAEDAVPNRLTAATQAAETLVDAVGGDPANRLAVAAFAGRGVLRYPLTDNLGAVADVLTRLRPGSVRPGGTDLGAGLNAALDAFGTDERADGRVIVILSDGEDLAGRWSSALERVDQMGVMVHAVTIGDPRDGHLVPSGAGEQPLTYKGQPVRSKRNDEVLEAIAQQSGGAVVRLGLASADLESLYRTRIAPLARRRREAAQSFQRPERFPLFLAAALGLLLTGWWPRKQEHRWPWNRDHTRAVAVVAAVTAGVLSAAAPNRSQSDDVAAIVARGREHYAAERWADALACFQQAIQQVGEQAVLRYNTAAALFQLERFPEAADLYRSARREADPMLSTKIDYALGNCALSTGDLHTAIEHYDRCLESSARGPDLDRVRRDAQLNRQFALEQAASALGTRGGTGGDPTPPPARRRPRGTRESRSDGDSENELNAGKEPNSGGALKSGGGENRSRQSRRRSGGGGRSASAPRDPGGTPDDRLDDALEAIREAQRHRLPEDSTAERSGATRKDW